MRRMYYWRSYCPETWGARVGESAVDAIVCGRDLGRVNQIIRLECPDCLPRIVFGAVERQLDRVDIRVDRVVHIRAFVGQQTRIERNRVGDGRTSNRKPAARGRERGGKLRLRRTYRGRASSCVRRHTDREKREGCTRHEAARELLHWKAP